MFRSMPLLPRWGRRSTLGAPSSLRLGAQPPSLRHAPDSAWHRLVFWLMAPAAHDSAAPPSRLPRVRGDFLAALADVDDDRAGALRHRIDSAHSLRELWHLRAEVFQLVGVTHSQFEAEQRLVQLNTHFPTRAPRSQFAGL